MTAASASSASLQFDVEFCTSSVSQRQKEKAALPWKALLSEFDQDPLNVILNLEVTPNCCVCWNTDRFQARQ